MVSSRWNEEGKQTAGLLDFSMASLWRATEASSSAAVEGHKYRSQKSVNTGAMLASYLSNPCRALCHFLKKAADRGHLSHNIMRFLTVALRLTNGSVYLLSGYMLRTPSTVRRNTLASLTSSMHIGNRFFISKVIPSLINCSTSTSWLRIAWLRMMFSRMKVEGVLSCSGVGSASNRSHTLLSRQSMNSHIKSGYSCVNRTRINSDRQTAESRVAERVQ